MELCIVSEMSMLGRGLTFEDTLEIAVAMGNSEIET